MPVTPDQAPDLAGEDEGVAGLQHLEVALLDLADLAPRRAPAAEAIRTLSMAGEMMAPTFIRWRRAVSPLRTRQRPSRPFTMRAKRS